MDGSPQHPPQRWTTGGYYGRGVTEIELLQSAQALASTLTGWGWDTVVIGAGWSEFARPELYPGERDPATDRWSRQHPAVDRFPSSAGSTGFRKVADQLHALGLRVAVQVPSGVAHLALERRLAIFGSPFRAEHVVEPAGEPATSGAIVKLDHSHPGTRQWFDSQAALFASWGIDEIELVGDTDPADISAFRSAVERSGREMRVAVAGVHDGDGTTIPVEETPVRWTGIESRFRLAAEWVDRPFSESRLSLGTLPIGLQPDGAGAQQFTLTVEEQRTALTLWCLAGSQMTIGGGLLDMPAGAIETLSNSDVLALSTRTDAREVRRDDSTVIWSASDSGSGAQYLVVFNLDADPRPVSLPASEFGLTESTVLRDLWSGALTAPRGGWIESVVAGHGVLALRVA